jgi:hypothetical protein
MKIFFDTNVYVAEALLGEIAEELLAGHREGFLAHPRHQLSP